MTGPLARRDAPLVRTRTFTLRPTTPLRFLLVTVGLVTAGAFLMTLGAELIAEVAAETAFTGARGAARRALARGRRKPAAEATRLDPSREVFLATRED